MTTTAFVLSLMYALIAQYHEQPAAWEDSYKTTAEAIANRCAAAPLPGGGAEWCEAVLVVQAHQESRFNPEAVHDHGQGHGLYGVHEATLGRAVPDDADGQTEAALELLRLSFRACSAQPLDERLAQFASGYCDQRRPLSRYRLHMAARLLRSTPAE